MKNRLTKGRVLLVEDDKLLMLVSERLMDKLGYEVVGNAQTASEAVTAVRELDPDLVIMDISLNGEKDGIEAMADIRSFSDIPVIFLSGSSDGESYDRAKETGFVDFLVKPVAAEDLVGPLNRAMNPQSRATSKKVNRVG